MDEKDTAENRLKAIEVLVGGDYGLDAEWYNHFSKRNLSREKIEDFVVEFGKIITNCYVISHGFNSKCCKGKGKEMMEFLLQDEVIRYKEVFTEKKANELKEYLEVLKVKDNEIAKKMKKEIMKKEILKDILFVLATAIRDLKEMGRKNSGKNWFDHFVENFRKLDS